MANEKRLIFLEDAVEKIVNFPSKVAHDAFYGRKQFTPMQMLNVVAERQHEIIDLLETVKEVDAVEVVRCKDCKWYNPKGGVAGQKTIICSYQPKDFFCSYGERKDNERKAD